MFAEFTIDTRTFVGLAGARDDRLMNLFETVFEFWTKYGIYVDTDGEFLAIIDRLPPWEKQRFWKAYTTLTKEAVRIRRSDASFDRMLGTALGKEGRRI